MTRSPRTESFQELLSRYWKRNPSPEQARALELARDALHFVSATGQRYRFEDFRRGALEMPEEVLGGLQERLREAARFFRERQEAAGSAEEKELLQHILDTFHFIASTSQSGPFADFLEHLESKAPPHVVASFESREDAEAWLRHHPSPPDSADVLIANAYHDVVYDRETGLRRLPRNRNLERHLAWLVRHAPPVAGASFATLEEADAWLKAQPAPARWEWVRVGDEFYLAAFYPHLEHRALFPLSATSEPAR
jgi:hypothetical protein